MEPPASLHSGERGGLRALASPGDCPLHGPFWSLVHLSWALGLRATWGLPQGWISVSGPGGVGARRHLCGNRPTLARFRASLCSE